MLVRLTGFSIVLSKGFLFIFQNRMKKFDKLTELLNIQKINWTTKWTFTLMASTWNLISGLTSGPKTVSTRFKMGTELRLRFFI